MTRRFTMIAAAVWFLAAPASAQQLAPIRYTVSFPDLRNHLVEVSAVIPADGQRQIDLMMPVWTPGSYLVREYSRNVESLEARDGQGQLLALERTRKNRWRVTSGGAAIHLRYRLYAHEMSVRTDWADEEFALLNGAATYITRLEHRDRPYEVEVHLPTAWKQSVSAMEQGAANLYRAPDYDTLVDSPIVAGNPVIYSFVVAGKPHYLVDISERGSWDGAKAVADLEKVTRQIAAFWGTVPFDRFYFLNILGAPTNGLEHKGSVTLNYDRDSMGTRNGYLGWLNLASHEYFHAWNVKRLRPVELGPFDYENEAYTKSLWFVEGVTDYYAPLMVHRAGVSTRDEYLEALSADIAALQSTPGRLVQPVELASYDAWIEYYRPDENSANASISYYTKGSVIGFLMDAFLRSATAGAKSLDDFMRLMYQRYSGKSGFTADQLRDTAAELAGGQSAGDMRAWMARVLDSTGELEYKPALDWFGLIFKPLPEKPRAWLGIRTRMNGQRTIVSEVRRGSPADAGGLAIDDELVAVNEADVAGKLTERLASFAPDSTVSFTILRRGATDHVSVRLGTDPTQQWQLGIEPSPMPGQAVHQRSWFGDVH